MLLRTLTLAALSLMLAACNISGSAQKGPFKAGSSISASQIDTSASPIASTTINTQVTSTQGGFSVQQIPWNGWAELVVTGQYFDEFANADSSEALTLNTITNKNRRFDTANIHLFSHLAAARMRQRVSDGQNMLNAWRDTQSEMIQLFGLNQVTRNINRGVEQLNPVQGSGRYRRDNANLLLFTGSFLATGGNATSLLALTDDFADDAQFNGVGETAFNAIAIAANTEGLLQKLSTNLSANGASNPPNTVDMQELPIWVNTSVVTEPDTIAPVITLEGSAVVEVFLGGTYTEQGATANDNIDGDISANIVIAGDTVDTSEAFKSFEVTYNVSDEAGNPASEVTRTVLIIPDDNADTTAPVISLNGSSSINVVVGSTYTDEGATASDNKDGDISDKIVIGGGPIVTNVAGRSFTLTYNVSDEAQNAATEVTRTVNIVQAPDTTAPVISLNGSSSVNVVVGSTYTDEGATASDNKDGDISDKIVIGGGPIVTNVAGRSFTLTYNVSDEAQNAATEVTRTVNIIAPEPYKIVLRVFIGGELVNVDNLTLTRPRNTSRTSIYNSIESTAAIVDSTGRVIEGKKPTFDISNIDLTVVGETAVTLSFTDEFQRTVTNTVTIKIINNAPTAAAQALEVDQDTGLAITLGASDIDQNDSLTYTITSPPSNGSLSGTAPDITYTPNTGFIGDDNFTFTAKDGLAESTATITITVKDTVAPVISLNGSSSVDVVVGSTYTEQATASDNKDGNISDKIVIAGGPIVTSVAGRSFTLTYNVSDAANNKAVEVTRTVMIIEQPVVVANTCTATAITELGGIIPGPVPFNRPPFRDFFVTNEKGNIPWPEGQNYNQLTVSDIENIFNRARQDDPTTYGVALKMPTQAVWDAYSDAEKALYLINSERCDREIRPYEGIDTAKNIDPSKNYAELLATQFAAGELTELTHEADGNPKIRLERAGVYEEVRGGITATDINADSFQFSENLARNSVSLRSENPTASYPTVHEPIAKAVYAWLYQDAGATYGHRKFVLAIGLEHNSGKENVEGILSVGVAINQSTRQGISRDGSAFTTYTTEVFTVQNGFDPNEYYDMSNVSSVNLVKPDSCLPGYTKTFDDFGPFYCRPILPPLQ